VDGDDSAGEAICRDGVIRALGLWPTTAGTVKVTYNAGYTDDELRGRDKLLDASPIWKSAKAEAARYARKMWVTRSGRLGLIAGVPTSEGLGDYNYSMDGKSIASLMDGDLTAESIERLSPFINLGYELGS
jgi:hypothetical protein